ncbi:TetR family transcriptional regulator [Amycolatopsis mediterranei S699]|uniref:TetR family transcriptional regulator n=2 Tax=Amycolatopsis mediterranei TaxID=33910 RepID=A0A0H3D549_AMYMU|nr:TetR/AcrR family transcriptional regulator [Amycolatopsis mediterranei]ADJ45382.1 TetR family transcriptional regulator [Amycolatopsis mediterranei U32]AEK42144.1 TetR family transcriptional regulator [Amycolatopsis mediterranei S699]AFO77093.1 TetR family transcriptional regulator [Amycolatopsis mediterranei S699]AGT84221.1 TetR family transcriptional regulator [Amycolatopsis mediterranei RB]KDO05958.1 TetR family transcriptional regulator [Amycolatopsis mediterranei]
MSTLASGDVTRPPATGRPRDHTRDLAILDATLSLLTEVGYEQLSIEAVAGRSGAAKTTIYRRYRDKAALVTAAIEHRAPAKPPQPEGESLREDVHSLATWLARSISEQDVGLLGAMFTGMRTDVRLAQEMRHILRQDQSAMTDGLAAERLTPGAAALFAEVAPAVILHRVVVVGEPCDADFVAHLVDDILMPLLRRP